MSRASDAEHYARVHQQYAEIEAKSSREGWSFEYIETPYEVSLRRNELIGKLVYRAYWTPSGDALGVRQPAYIYKSMFKRLADVVTNSPVTGFALLFEDGERDSLCYVSVCVATREPSMNGES